MYAIELFQLSLKKSFLGNYGNLKWNILLCLPRKLMALGQHYKLQNKNLPQDYNFKLLI